MVHACHVTSHDRMSELCTGWMMLLRRLWAEILVCCCLFVALPLALDAPDSREWILFDDFLTQYNKSYKNNSTVVLQRFRVFQESLSRHEQLNTYEALNGGTAVYGVNKFSDLTQEEFKRIYASGLSPGPLPKADHGFMSHPATSTNTPNKFDWREKGVIGGIRNQQRCGSCWAFAIVETMASRYAITNHPLYELSAQQLISCEYYPNEELDGCRGGALVIAFEMLVQNNMTVVLDSVYPFDSGEDGVRTPCRQPLPNVGVQLKSYNYSVKFNETDMQDLLSTISPLTTSVNAVPWQDYIGGIIQHHCSDSPDNLDHAVQIVGYDLTGPIPYWIVRNTWGTNWGENGYVRIKFGSNVCGISDEVAAVMDVVGINL